MIDAFGLPQAGVGNVKLFLPTGSTARGVQVWNKPKNASFCMFIVWSGGGGGGSGHTAAAAAARGGGGGGACSGIARFFVPAIFVPDRLFISVGAGGRGGVAGAGSAGENTFITTCPPLTAGTMSPLPNIWLVSGVNAPGGGGAGSGAAAGTAGTVPTIAVVQPHHLYGQWSATVGLVGVAGGAVAGGAGVSVNTWAAHCFSSGGGGGGTTSADFNGGAQTLTARYSVTGKIEMATTALPGGAAGSNAGNAGLTSLAPFLNCGGSGGGSSNTGVGGAGGTGGYGCGGGGGGGGTTGGAGGNGGPGGALIVSI